MPLIYCRSLPHALDGVPFFTFSIISLSLPNGDNMKIYATTLN